jgi:hypothetical protein
MQWIHCSPRKQATFAIGCGNSRVSGPWWVASDEATGEWSRCSWAPPSLFTSIRPSSGLLWTEYWEQMASMTLHSISVGRTAVSEDRFVRKLCGVELKQTLVPRLEREPAMHHALLLQQLVGHFQRIHGLRAIVLGGHSAGGAQMSVPLARCAPIRDGW